MSSAGIPADDDLVPLLDDAPARPQSSAAGAWRVLVVDDDADVHTATALALREQDIEGRPLELLHAYSAAEAFQTLSEDEAVAVVLLDVVMETPDAGLRLVARIRDELGRDAVRIILRTGQPGYAPEIDTMRRFDINDYRTKAELTRERLFASLTAALRTYRLLMDLLAQRDELRMLNESLAQAREAEREAAGQRLAAEQALRAAHEGIERQVEQRTRELADALTELEGFNRMVSHDLRGPLHGLSDLSALARRKLAEGDVEKVLHWLTVMEKQCASLAVLVTDLLDLARSASGPMQVAPVDLGTALGAALQTLALVHGDEVHRRVRALALPTVVGDAGLLRQVFVNLVGNAFKFVQPGEAVDVIVEADETPEGWCVAVQDRGIGFPPERAADLFRPFTRLHPRSHPGTGIGLTVVRRIVERHGGSVSAASEPGRGARFSFTLPRQH